MARSYRLPILLTAEEQAQLDVLRGEKPRAVFIRERIFAAPPTAQDAPSAPIDAPPPPPPKEEFVLPPAGSAAAQALYFERTGKDSGTLHCHGAQVDLIGVELEALADGSMLLRFSDRSLVRTGEGE